MMGVVFRTGLSEEDYSENRRQNGKKSRALPHRRGDGLRFNRELNAVTKPEPSPQGDELVPLSR